MPTRRETLGLVFCIAMIAALVIFFFIKATEITSYAAAPKEADIHCTIFDAYGDDRMLQLDCYGPVLREAYEALVKPEDVYKALEPMMAEWRTDVLWYPG